MTARPLTAPDTARVAEWFACAVDPARFVDRHTWIYAPAPDGLGGRWIPFRLWPAQRRVLGIIHAQQKTVVLKARQLGLSWLVLGYALWQLLFRPAASVSVFSRREEEAAYLLGPERLRGMYAHLPAWMRAARVVSDNDRRWELSTGSVARAFPTSAGDAYVNTLVLGDEFDLVEDQDALLRAVEPTMDAGGKLVLISRAAQRTPQSLFKRIYRAARAGTNDWTPVFLPWSARPDRDAAWYARQVAAALADEGSRDRVMEQYPASDAEALAPASANKRLPAAWLLACYQATAPLPPPRDAPALPGLVVYARPHPVGAYVVGADPAEGLSAGDASSATVVDVRTGAEVAALAGQIEPEAFGRALAALAAWYGRAGVLVERNNHGHAVLVALRAGNARILPGLDGRPGWLSSPRGKVELYDTLAATLAAGDAVIRSYATFTELSSIERGSLRAPAGTHDDAADGFALAQAARLRAAPTAGQSSYLHGGADA